MSDFSFRCRFNVSRRSNISSDVREVELPGNGEGPRISLLSGENDTPLSKAEFLVLKGSGYKTAEDAEAAGLHYQDVLMLTLARLRIGSDFGNRKGKGGFFQSFLENHEARTGERLLNNVHGLMVYSTNPPPEFAFLPVGFKLGCTEERLKTLFKFVEHNPPDFKDRDRIALELFNASFFTTSADTRLITLVVAIECLIEPEFRNPVARRHVENLIEMTRRNSELDSADRASYLTTLGFLQRESIRQAGKRLVTERLSERMYQDMSPAKFFSKVYDLRSDLVHGNMPYPDWEEVSNWSANLEVFVADLIAHSTLDFT
jgi:hypothetical protein